MNGGEVYSTPAFNPAGESVSLEIKTKKCGKCGEIKFTTEYWKNSASKDRFQSMCKTCHTETSKIRKNLNKKREYMKKYHQSRKLIEKVDDQIKQNDKVLEKLIKAKESIELALKIAEL